MMQDLAVAPAEFLFVSWESLLPALDLVMEFLLSNSMLVLYVHNTESAMRISKFV